MWKDDHKPSRGLGVHFKKNCCHWLPVITEVKVSSMVQWDTWPTTEPHDGQHEEEGPYRAYRVQSILADCSTAVQEKQTKQHPKKGRLKIFSYFPIGFLHFLHFDMLWHILGQVKFGHSAQKIVAPWVLHIGPVDPNLWPKDCCSKAAAPLRGMERQKRRIPGG